MRRLNAKEAESIVLRALLVDSNSQGFCLSSARGLVANDADHFLSPTFILLLETNCLIFQKSFSSCRTCSRRKLCLHVVCPFKFFLFLSLGVITSLHFRNNFFLLFLLSCILNSDPQCNLMFMRVFLTENSWNEMNNFCKKINNYCSQWYNWNYIRNVTFNWVKIQWLPIHS